MRALSGRSARQRHGQFLVEGPQAVREAVRCAAGAVRDVYLSEGAAGRYPEIVEAARAERLHLHLGTPEVLDAMSPDAQGVVAVVRRDAWDAPLERVLADIDGVRPPATRQGPGSRVRLAAVLAHVRDPGNAGTVTRAADAAGADLVVLAGHTVASDNPKLVRSTAGSLFHLPVVTGGAVSDVIAALRSAGAQILAADGAGDLDLDDLVDDVGSATGPGGIDLARPTAWLFGNEAWGLPAEDLALADAVVRVPIHGRAESLNLATAATVCLYASARAHRPPRTVPGDVTP